MPAPAQFEVTGDWQVLVRLENYPPATFPITPPPGITVSAERYDTLPVFNPKAGGWAKGAALQGVRAQECTNPYLVRPATVVLRAEPEGPALRRGVDYEIDLDWGTFGRIEGGLSATQSVYASYEYSLTRLDAVVLTKGGKLDLIPGMPRAAAPAVPALPEGARHLGNIYLPGPIARLTQDHVYPVLEDRYPEQKIAPTPTVERLRKRLSNGETLRILAWGDSVTDAVYLPNRDNDRWQQQFVTRLRKRYPGARIELQSEAWGGRNTRSYLEVPPGSPHNYQETVLAKKPDLIISEFVNDAGLNPAQVEERYTKLLADFKAIGAEWIILTPHYVRPDWMQLTRERDIDDDPRPYVRGVREFASRHDVALADASLRYGRLWRQGIPYNTLMLNAINHPNAYGMKQFADALMALFES